MKNQSRPRKTTIRGQRHLLAYITPDEAKLLKAHGGSGEMHKGVPAFRREDGPGSPSEGHSSHGFDGGVSDAGGRDGAGDDRQPFSGTRQVGGLPKAAPKAPVNPNQAAIDKVQGQIKQGADYFKNRTKSQALIDTFMPFAGINPLQAGAAQYMGGKMIDVLKTEGSRAAMDPRTGRVSGAYDALGRLTGRDPVKEAEEEAKNQMFGGDDRSNTSVAKQAAALEEPQKKEVIRTDLAKKIEEERRRRLAMGMSQLGTRTLLASGQTLGAS